MLPIPQTRCVENTTALRALYILWSYLGPLAFVILIASLQPPCHIHKFIDDITMTEVITEGSTSCMQAFVDELVSQSTKIGMTVNGKKTKEMLIGSVVKNPPVPVSLNDMTVDQVSTFKLLGVQISNDLLHCHPPDR